MGTSDGQVLGSTKIVDCWSSNTALECGDYI